MEKRHKIQEVNLNKFKNQAIDAHGIINEDLCQNIFENVVRRLLEKKEYYDEEEELDPFEEYQQDYPNGDFDVSDMTPERLAKWCENVGDFLYVYKGLRGLSIMVANTNSIISDIVNDLYWCNGIEPTHEVDYLFSSREREFEDNYVCIFKIIGINDGDYYVVYQRDKSGLNDIDLYENKSTLNESFKSNERNRMSDWKNYQNMRVNDIDSYLKKCYAKGLK